MTNNNLYQRQNTIERLDTNQVVVLVGAGGIGAWVGLFLALAGIKELHIFDPDSIEEHNLNRLLYIDLAVEQNKASALKDLIKMRRPDLPVFYYPFAFQPNVLAGLNPQVVIAAVDNQTTRDQTKEYAEAAYARWLNLGCGQNSVTVTKGKSTWTGGNEDGGYEGVPQWIIPNVLAAALGVHGALYDPLTSTNILAPDLVKLRQGLLQ